MLTQVSFGPLQLTQSQVGHNLGQSDFVFVLLSSTTRIAQSLDLNRLGPDTGPSKDPIGREIKKRLWWFLVKQDWSKYYHRMEDMAYITEG